MLVPQSNQSKEAKPGIRRRPPRQPVLQSQPRYPSCPPRQPLQKPTKVLVLVPQGNQSQEANPGTRPCPFLDTKRITENHLVHDLTGYMSA